jgi:hypothetical protein
MPKLGSIVTIEGLPWRVVETNYLWDPNGPDEDGDTFPGWWELRVEPARGTVPKPNVSSIDSMRKREHA